MDRIPCGLDDDRLWDQAEAINAARDVRVESYADELMSDCRVFSNAEAINYHESLYDGDLLPKLIVEIARWDGSSRNASVQMKIMFNLLADEFQKIAAREVR